MPYKNPDEKLARMAEWRRSRSAGYHKWLYDRRQLRFEDAERFRSAIEDALAADDAVEAERILNEALDYADWRAVQVGNRYDHELDTPTYEED